MYRNNKRNNINSFKDFKNNQIAKRILILTGIMCLFTIVPMLGSFTINQGINQGNLPGEEIQEDPNPISQNSGDPIAYLKALWSFEPNGYNRRIGYNSHDLSLFSAEPAYSSSGKWGEAVNFDLAAYDTLNAGDHNDFDITTSFSWGCWVNPDIITGFDNGDSGAIMWKDGEYGLRISEGGRFQAFAYDVADAYQWNDITTSSTYTAGQWYHLMATLSGTTMKFYVNGVDVGTQTITTLPSTKTANLIFGAQYTEGLRYDGRVDDIRIYGTALTQTQVQGVMTQQIYYSQLLTNPNFDSDATGWTYWDSSGADDDYWSFSEDEPPSNAKFHAELYTVSGSENINGYVQQALPAVYFASPTDCKYRVIVNLGHEIDDGSWNSKRIYIGSSYQDLPAVGRWSTNTFTFDFTSSPPSNYLLSSQTLKMNLDGHMGTDLFDWTAHTYYWFDYIYCYALWMPSQNPYVSSPADKNFDYTGTSGNYFTWLVSDTCFTTPRTVSIAWSGSTTGSTTVQWTTESQLIQYDIGTWMPGSWTFTCSLANDGFGGSFSDSASLTISVTYPNAPTWAATPLTLSAGQVIVDWVASSFHGGDPNLTYKVYRKPQGGSYSVVQSSLTDTIWIDPGGMTGGINYYYRISAVNSKGEGAQSTEQYIMYYKKPTVPLNFRVTGHGDQSLNLAWDPPADNGGLTPTYYIVRSYSGLFNDNLTFTTTDTYYNFNGLENGHVYYFRIFARNSQGDSPTSSTIQDDPRYSPDAPATPSVIGYGDGWVKIQWSAPDNNGRAITNYQICRALSAGGTYTPIGTTGSGSILEYNDTTGTNGVPYYYKVQAYNSEGWGPLSPYVMEEPRTVPAAPVWITTDPKNIEGDGYANLDWNDPYNGGRTITRYYIYKRTPGGAWDAGIYVSGNPAPSFYQYTGLTNGQAYEFKVRGFNTEGLGYESQVLYNIVPHVTLNAPTVTSVSSGVGSLTVNWNIPSNWQNCRAIDHYSIYMGTTSGLYTYIANISAGLYTYTNNSLVNGQKYYMKISAVDNNTNEGVLSAEFWVRPLTNPGQPGQPSGIEGNNQISLSWSASAVNNIGGVVIQRYQIFRQADGGAWVWLANTTDGSQTTYIDYTAQNNHYYYYRIMATIYVDVSFLGSTTYYMYRHSINSTDSAQLRPYTVPDAPTITGSSTFGNQNNTIYWTQPDCQGRWIDKYYVFRTTTQGVYDYNNPVYTTPNNVTFSWMDTGLINGQSYWYKVIAHNVAGNSSPSAESAELIPAWTPLAATSLSTVNGSKYVQINWHWEISYNNGRTPIRFHIYRNTTTGGPAVYFATVTATFLETYTDNTALASLGKDYLYWIQAENIIGNGSMAGPVLGHPEPGPPSAPTNVRTIGEGNGYVRIKWDWILDYLDEGIFKNFTIYRGDIPTFSADGSSYIGYTTDNSTCEYQDNTAVNGRQYYYKVIAANIQKGNGPASESTGGKAYTVPSQVQGVSIAFGHTQLNISWSLLSTNYQDAYFDGGRPVLYYRVYRNDTGVWNQVHQTADGSVTSWVDTGLTNGVVYYYKVAAVNIAGKGADSEIASEYPCGVPLAPSFNFVTAIVGGVNMSWVAGGTNGSAILGYLIYRSSDGSNYNLVQTINNPATLDWYDTSVTYGTYYFYKVRAFNRAGNGYNSTVFGALPITTPSAPLNVQVIYVKSQNVTFTWDAPSYNGGSTISGYVVYQSENGGAWTYVGTTSASQRIFSKNDLTNGLHYQYKVAAYNNGSRTATPGGEGDNSTIVGGTPITVPNAPENVQVILVANGEMTIQWSAPSFTGGIGVSITGYVIYRQENNGAWTEEGVVGGSTFTFNQNTLVNGRYYNYRVAAYNNGSRHPTPPEFNPGGEGANSTIVNGRPITVPGAVATILTTLVVDSGIRINWTAPSFTGGEGVTIDGYVIYRQENGGAWEEQGTVNGFTFYFEQGTLINGRYYGYKVAAWNNGSRHPSNPTMNPGGEGTNSSVVGGRPISKPGAPTGLIVYEEYDGKLTLRWTAPVNQGGEGVTIDGYVLYRGMTSDNLFFYKTIADPLAVEYNDTGLTNGLMYFYRIAAYNNGSRTPIPPELNPGGEGSQSNLCGGMPITIPTAPRNFRVTSLDGGILLEWDDPTYTGGVGFPLTGYVIYRGLSEGTCVFLTVIGDINSWVDTISLTHGVTYYYKIAAYNNGSRTAAPGGEGPNATEIPHATPTLFIEFTLLDPALSPITGAEVYLKDLSGIYEYTNYSISGGKVGFGGLNNSVNYRLYVRNQGYYVLNITNGYSIDTTQFYLTRNIICNLTNVIITMKDLTGFIVANAFLRLQDPTLGTTFEGTTNTTGQVVFYQIYNASWNVYIEFSTGANNYKFIINTTSIYQIQTALYLANINLVANLTTVTIYCTDTGTLPPYDMLYNANLTLVSPTTGNNITWFYTNSTGYAKMQVPADEYNVTIVYQLKMRLYSSSDPFIDKQITYKLNFNVYSYFHLEVEISESPTSIFVRKAKYIQPTWGTHDSNLDNYDLTPNYLVMYYRDGVTFTLYWQNNRNLQGIDNATIVGSWNSWVLTRDGVTIDTSTSHPYALKPVTGQTGNYTFEFNSASYGFSGTYQLDLIVGEGNTYQFATFSITITVMNFTSALTLTSSYQTLESRTSYYNEQLTIDFNFNSVLPIAEPITGAVLNWMVIGQSVTGTLTNLGGGLYQLQYTFATLSPNTYQLRIFGNESNYDFIYSTPITFAISARPTLINVIIDPNYRITDNYIVAAWMDNITIDFELLDVRNSGVALSGITVYILYNSTDIYSIGSFCVYAIDSDTYRFTIPANFSTVGMHSIYIQLSLANHTSSSITIDIQVLEYWGAYLSIYNPPYASYWAENITFTLQYLCRQDPRNGLLLDGATISQLKISAYIGGNIYHQITLTTGSPFWGYRNLGSGLYEIWFLSDVLNMSVKTLFYVEATFNYSNYESATKSPYVYISPLNVDWSYTTPNQLSNGYNFAYLEQEYNEEDTVTIMGFYKVSQSGHKYDGFSIDDAIGSYEIRRTSDNTLVDSGELGVISGGRYYFLLFADTLGEYRVSLWVQKECYKFANRTFTYKVIKDIVFEVEINNTIKIGPTSMKLAQGENITLIINVTDPIATNPTVNIYLGGNLVSSSYIYQFETKKFLYTQQISAVGFPVGDYEVKVVVSQDQFNTAYMTLQMQVIENWATAGLMNFKTFEMTTWSNNITFDVVYYPNEIPRIGTVLSSATVLQIQFYKTVGGFDYLQVTLDSSTRGKTWNFAYIGFDAYYGKEVYQVSVNTSILTLTQKETFKIYVTIKQQYYQQQTFNSYCWVDTLDTSLTSLGGPVVNMGMNFAEQFQFRLNVTDLTSGLLGRNVAGATIQYKLSNASREIYGSSTTYLGNGVYEIEIDPILNSLFTGTYTLYLNASVTNYTLAELTITLQIFPGAVKFNLIISPEFRVDAYTVQASLLENVLLWIQIDESLDTSDIVVTVVLDGNPLVGVVTPDDPVPKTYKIMFPVSSYDLGIHSLTIEAAKFGYISDYATLNLYIIETWQTDIEIVTPPSIKPWNSNVSMIFRYQCIDGPRNGWMMNNSVITQLKLDLITETGTIEKLLLTTGSQAWGYQDLKLTLGAGYYLVWFNTSYLEINQVSAFYITPKIVDLSGIYENNTVQPYLWVKEVKTALYLTSDAVTNLVSDGLILQLNEQTDLYAKYMVTDLEAIIQMLNMNIDGATLRYDIYRKEDNQFITSVDLQRLTQLVNGYRYKATIHAITEGNYTVYVYADINNFSSAIAQFQFKVIKRTIQPVLDFNTADKAVKSPQNMDLEIIIDAKDELSGLPLSGATLSVTLGGHNYEFTEESGVPGRYIIRIPQSDIKNLRENELYTLSCSFSKTNYTTSEFTIYLNVGFRVDPIFGIPYRYWIIMAVTVGTLVSAVAIRRYYLKASTPLVIQHINKVAKIMKKKRAADIKQLEKSREEEMLALFGSEWRMLRMDMHDALGLEKEKGEKISDTEAVVDSGTAMNIVLEDFKSIEKKLSGTEDTPSIVLSKIDNILPSKPEESKPLKSSKKSSKKGVQYADVITQEDLKKSDNPKDDEDDFLKSLNKKYEKPKDSDENQ